MTFEAFSLVEKARRSLDAARALAERGDYDFSASRAYYTMFYGAEACLLTKGLRFSSHRGVISGFGQHFVKTGIFPEELHAALRFAFDQRNLADYANISSFRSEHAQTIIADAEKFIAAVEAYLTSLEGD